MARNKYPEVTVEKILDVSQRLFLEKGYDHTTIQDIVDELGGLSKGAIYHHFKSKEAILNALGDRLFFKNNPFEEVKKRTDLSGLEKIKLAILLNQSNEEQASFSAQAVPLLKNPRILAGMLETNRRTLCPRWLELIEEGCRDGSIQTDYPKELSELMVLLDVWLIPSVFPGSAEEIFRRYQCSCEVLARMGLPIYDEKAADLIRNHPALQQDV